MSDVLRQEGPKMAGLQALYFVPVAAVLAMPDLDEDGIALLGDVQLVPGASWSELQGTIYTPSLDVAGAITVHGPGYDHELTGLYGGDQPAAAGQFQRMQGKRFIVLYRDYDGLVRVIGSPRGGLEFSHKQALGTTPGQRKGYTWSFKGRTATPALFYGGILPTGLAPAPGVATGGTVLLYAGTRLLAIVPAGKRIVLKSGFKLKYEIQ
jgi:hypothetical protein